MSFDETVTVPLIHLDGGTSEANLYLWEQSPENPDAVRMLFEANGKQYIQDADNFFAAFCMIRSQIEPDGVLICCYGSSRNVYPSGAMLSMGPVSKGYKLYMGEPARSEDIVLLFDTGSDVTPVTVDEQKSYYKQWIESLKKLSE